MHNSKPPTRGAAIDGTLNETLVRRNELLSRSVDRLPGSVPYDNYRPINVPARFDGHTLLECLCGMHPHISLQQWRDWFQLGHILREDEPIPTSQVVRCGQQYRHLFPDTVEPDVDARIQILWEDDALVVVNKPAPLPVHPCGQFNRNTMTSLLRCAYQASDLRLVHRLDANTTGLMLLTRTRTAAMNLGKQFESNKVHKRYVVRCCAHPASETFTCNDPIARKRSIGGTRVAERGGHAATTEFRVIRRLGDGSSLLEARPLAGRTNQIRVHLWGMGTPVVGDPAYLQDRRLAAQQTLRVDQPPMCLHAAELSLTHPESGETLDLVAPDPPWLDQLASK